MPEQRIRVLTGSMFGRLVLIMRRADGRFTYRIQEMGNEALGRPGFDCGIYDSAATAEAEAWARRGAWLDGGRAG